MLRKVFPLMMITLFGWSIPASAATYLISITGTVTGSSPGGVFGPGANLIGLPFSATMSYDPTIGYRETTATYDSVDGGTSGGFSSPSKGASFTLNGTTFNIPGNWGAGISETNEIGTSYSSYSFYDEPTIPNGYLHIGMNFFISHPYSPGSNLENPFTGQNLSGFGQFVFAPWVNGAPANPSFVQLDNFSITSRMTGGNMPSAVPEPGSWALMIVGFGLVGGAIRIRRTPIAAEA